MVGLVSHPGSISLQCPGSFQGATAQGCLFTPSQILGCDSLALGLMLQEKQNHQASSMPGYFLPFSQAGPETQQSESTLMVLEGGRKWRTKKKKKQTAQDLLLGASYMEEWWESESWAEDIYRLERPRGGLLRTHTPTQ